MPTGRIATNYAIAGMNFISDVQRTAEGGINQTVPLAAGVAGAVSAAAGVDGLPTGHGFAGAEVIDIHWDDPVTGFAKCRYSTPIDAAAANSITLFAGSGDALPAEDTPVVISYLTYIDIDFDGDFAEIVAMKCSVNSFVNFTRTVGGVAKVVHLVADELWSWVSDQNVANPLTGNAIGYINLSNASVTAGTFYCGVAYNSS